jgi:peptide/nickel transport system substrate-binding protein
MRPTLYSLTLAAFFLAACVANTPEPLSTPTFLPVASNMHTPVPPTPAHFPQRASVLRIAILRDTTTTNVWALFDKAGADYWSVATQAGYWPSLYRLAPPLLNFQPAVAKGRPAPIVCDTANCTTTVALQPGLTWTDGSAFSAADVVFTINTALQFRLGLNWQGAYNPDVLDHAEALDELTVKFYFKSMPTVADWQYGALLGPIVNRAHWQPRIADVTNLLPDESLLATIKELEAERSWMQAELGNVKVSLTSIAPGSTAYINTTRQANRLKEDLTGVYNKLEKKRAEYETKLTDARAALFTFTNVNEPTLGPWKFANRTTGSFENQANLGTPFGDPWFGSVRYVAYSDESAAVDALLNDEVDIFLTPDGLSSAAVSRLENNSEILLWRNTTHSARFLAFNYANPDLADPVLHQAVACMLDPQALIENLGDDAAPLPGFVVDDFWRQGEADLPCAGETGDARLTEAIRLMKVAGYLWDVEPASGVNGSGLKGPGGNVLPDHTLLTLEQDLTRERAARYITRQAEILGLSINVRIVGLDELLYAVYNSGDYDMALLGWRLSAYPSYLCEWFMPLDQNPFAYNGSKSALGGDERLESACEAWSQVSDLDMARAYAFEVQSALMADLPLIPLYTSVRVDAYRNIRYPFAKVVDGLGFLYGAPELVIPIP